MVRDILLIGCGKMGRALLDGWVAGSVAETVYVVEPSREAVPSVPGVEHLQWVVATGLSPSVIVFAVKPQVMAEVLPVYRPLVRPGTLFLSIAAGKPLAFFDRHLGPEAAVVRAMPNTPASIGAGITVAVKNDRVGGEQAEQADRLLAAAGEVAWVDDEALIDAVTAVSGGGPAYVFLLMETLAQAGAAAGLPKPLAERLARVTVQGAGELARRSDDMPEVLRKNVTSPGGTTEQALSVLMAPDGLQPLMDRAIMAATVRSRALAD